MRQLGLAVGLLVCNTKSTSGESGALTTELQMDTLHTKVENTKLSPWMFAVNWGVITLQQKIVEMESRGLNPIYDIRQLENLQDLEQFLKMSWDQWLDRLNNGETAQEVK